MTWQTLPDNETNLRKAAAVAIVNPENKVLLMKRPQNDGGDWVYPGGSLDEGETPDEAARRETQEEVGLTLEGALFPLANYLTAPDAYGNRHDLIVYIAKLAQGLEAMIASPREVVEIGWFDPITVINEVAAGNLRILESGVYAIERLIQYLSTEKVRTYGEVLMGGTFDRLHDGHKQLLQKAFEVGDYVYIGLTTDQYINASQKKHKKIINSYNTRLTGLRRYLNELGVLNRTIILPLGDTAGPKALDPKLQALIVSEETQAGGQFVNDMRAKHGVEAMDIVVVPLLTDQSGTVVSSTRLREAESTFISNGE